MVALLKIWLCVSGYLVISTKADDQAYSGLDFQFPNSTTPVPFKVLVNPGFVEDTLAKIKRYRPIKGLYPTWTNEGPDQVDITNLASYWVENYHWSNIQDQINANFSHYAITVQGNGNYSHPIPLHFIHERSSQSNAIPLLLLHGWPSTFLEWKEVVHPLTTPNDIHGSPAFHVVAPDLPGFGFSPAPEYPGMDPHEVGAACDKLMRALGYTRYGIVSTDLGWAVGTCMANDLSSSVRAHFTDFFVGQPNATDLERYAAHNTSPEETAYITAYNAFFANHTAYQSVHIQKPLAAALAWADSPVGFAGWVWDILYTVGDDYKNSLEKIITDAFLLYLPGVYANIRAYKEFTNPAVFAFPKVSVPTGVSQWASPNGPYPEIANFPLTPRSWAERTANVTFFVRHTSGGHFPAISRTNEWLADVRRFFSHNS